MRRIHQAHDRVVDMAVEIHRLDNQGITTDNARQHRGLVVWLGYGKFYSLFSLLFGIGFSLQLDAAERRGDGTLSVFRRRLQQTAPSCR